MFTHFHHQQLRRYLIAFGSFFSDIKLIRKADGEELQRMVVPISHGPKERWYARLQQDPELLQGVGQIVPRMSYEISSINYDTTRKLNSLHKLTFSDDTAHRRPQVYVPVPYIININLSVLVKNQDDGHQIVEQILPYFAPDLSFTMNVIPEISNLQQISIAPTSISITDNYADDFEKRRVLEWMMGFAMKVNFYGPVRRTHQVTEVDLALYSNLVSDLSDISELRTETGDLLLSEDGDLIVNESTSDAMLDSFHVADVVATADGVTLDDHVDD